MSPMLALILLAGVAPALWTFDQAPAGRPPEGFEIVGMLAPAPRWVVERHSHERVLAQTAPTPDDMKKRHSFAVVKGAVYGDVVLKARVKLLSENAEAGLVFRYQDQNNHYLLTLDSALRRIRLVRVVGGNRVSIHGQDDVDLETGVWYQLAVRLAGPSIAARLYGIRLFEARDRTLPESGRIGFICDDNTRAHFDDLTAAPIGPN